MDTNPPRAREDSKSQPSELDAVNCCLTPSVKLVGKGLHEPLSEKAVIKAISIVVVVGGLVLAICRYAFPEVAVAHFVPISLLVGAVAFFIFFLVEKKWKKKEPEDKS